MKFKNVEKFEEWVKEVSKTFYGDIQPYLEEVANKYSCNASPCYEMKGFFTKSGHPECYYYDVEEIENKDERFETTFETTFIF